MGVFTINSDAAAFVRFLGGYDVSDSAIACTQAGTLIFLGYIPVGETLTTTTGIFSDFQGTTNAISGWYSDGTISRLWDDISGTFTNQFIC